MSTLRVQNQIRVPCRLEIKAWRVWVSVIGLDIGVGSANAEGGGESKKGEAVFNDRDGEGEAAADVVICFGRQRWHV
jgi:hypothetical protein